MDCVDISSKQVTIMAMRRIVLEKGGTKNSTLRVNVKRNLNLWRVISVYI